MNANFFLVLVFQLHKRELILLLLLLQLVPPRVDLHLALYLSLQLLLDLGGRNEEWLWAALLCLRDVVSLKRDNRVFLSNLLF